MMFMGERSEIGSGGKSKKIVVGKGWTLTSNTTKRGKKRGKIEIFVGKKSVATGFVR